MVAGNYSAVLAVGDLQYETGDLRSFQTVYDKTWGRVKSITHPAPGNHEYSRDAQAYYTYWGTAAGHPSKGYYSFEIGSWHVITINANCQHVGGCEKGSPEERWLSADLQAHPATCTLAFWHQPRFTSGSSHGNDPAYDAFWRDLYAAGADVIISAHEHMYERFAPQDPDARPDPSRGIREFVVGSGGKTHYPIGRIAPNSEVRNNDTYGVLELTLAPDGYDWHFVPETGKTFSDRGHGQCH